MLRYSNTKNNVSVPEDIPLVSQLLDSANSKAYILVLGPHLALQSHINEGRGNSNTLFYLRSLLNSMIEWCIQKNIIDQPDTIETFRQLSYRNSLVHTGNMLEEYLTEKEQLQLCR